MAAYLWHGQFLSRDRAAAALGEMSGCEPSPAIIKALLQAQVAHFDETGFRAGGKLAWVHSASSGKHVLVTVHARRGSGGMDAAGVLPSFAGIAVHGVGTI